MADREQHNEPSIAAPGANSLEDTAQSGQPGSHREPSQQDLEIARQLQSFQSQGANKYAHDRDNDTQSHTSRDATEPQINSSHAESLDESSNRPANNSTLTSELPPRAGSAEPQVGGQVCTNCGTTKTPLWRRSPAGAVICNACGLYYKARNQMRPVGLKRAPGTITTAPQRGSDSDVARGTSPTAFQGGATYVSADQSTNGTCPGGGRCNGTGGHDGCNGCPAYNNRISKTAQVALRQSNEGLDANANAPDLPSTGRSAPQTVVVACQNCGTTITPLWRRDEAGNAICNACGLYFKLHGQHRPVQMKKAEIKRRKRVVPANVNSESYHAAYNHEIGENDPRSGDARPTPQSLLHTHPIAIMEPRTAPGPIPVNFTDTFRTRQAQNEPHEYNVPSKRTYSATGPESEHYPHAQNMGFAAINAIDPSLPSRETPMSKEVRRAELQREADRMRQMLQEKERELAALTDE